MKAEQREQQINCGDNGCSGACQAGTMVAATGGAVDATATTSPTAGSRVRAPERVTITVKARATRTAEIATATAITKTTVQPAELSATASATTKATEINLAPATADAIETLKPQATAESISTAAATKATIAIRRTDLPADGVSASATSTAVPDILLQTTAEPTLADEPATPLSPVKHTAQAGATQTVRFATRATLARATRDSPLTQATVATTLPSEAAAGPTATATPSPIYEAGTAAQLLATSAASEITSTAAVRMTASLAVDAPELFLTATPLAEGDLEADRRRSTAIALSATLPTEDTLLTASTPQARDTGVAAATADTTVMTSAPHPKVTLSFTRTEGDPPSLRKPDLPDDVSYADRRDSAIRKISGSRAWPGRSPMTPDRRPQNLKTETMPEIAGTVSPTMALEPMVTAKVDPAATATEDRVEARRTESAAVEAKASPTRSELQDATEVAAESSPTADRGERTPAPTVQPAPTEGAVTSAVRATMTQPIHEPAATDTSAAAPPRVTQIPSEASDIIKTAPAATADQSALERATATSSATPKVSDSPTPTVTSVQTIIAAPILEMSASPAPPESRATQQETIAGVSETATPATARTASATATISVAATATLQQTAPPARTEAARTSAAPAATKRSSEVDARVATEEAGTKTAVTVSSAIQLAKTVTVSDETPPSPATDAGIEIAITAMTTAPMPTVDLTTRTDMTGVATRVSVETATPVTIATEPVDAMFTAAPAAESATPLPAVFAYLVATPTAFGAVDDSADAACEVVEGWLPYEVREGDSLLALALASGSSLIELREGNCFGPVTGIIVGDIIALPRLPESPIEPATPLFPVSDLEYQVLGCESVRAMIVEPRPMTELQGIFAVRGRAQIPEGGKYRISVKPAWSPNYHRFLDVERSVSDDVIGLINTEIFGPGLQRLRLEIVGDGEIEDGSWCEIPVVFKAP